MTLGAVRRMFSKISAPLLYRAIRALGRGGRVWVPVRESPLMLRPNIAEDEIELRES